MWEQADEFNAISFNKSMAPHTLYWILAGEAGLQ